MVDGHQISFQSKSNFPINRQLVTVSTNNNFGEIIKLTLIEEVPPVSEPKYIPNGEFC